MVKGYPKGRFSAAAKRALVSLGAASPPSQPAEPVVVKGVNYWSFLSYTRVVVELSDKTRYRPGRVENPERLFIDFNNAYLPRKMHNRPTKISDGVLKKVNIAQFDSKTVRLVLNLDQINNYRVVPFENPNRVVIDIFGENSRVKNDFSGDLNHYEVPEIPNRTNGEITLAQQLGLGVNTIVIDPGHGGKDPGAIGKSGLREKDVVLDISKQLKTLLEKNLSKKVILTRETDVFIPLEERTLLTQKRPIYLFPSIPIPAPKDRPAEQKFTWLDNQRTGPQWKPLHGKTVLQSAP